MNKKNYLLLVGILLIHVFLLVYLKFTAWPEMILWPYLITKGWLPYSDIAIAHTPLAIFDLAIFYKIFGTGVLQLKIFTWSLVLLSDILIFFVVKKLWKDGTLRDKKAAFLSLIFYILWMLFYDGNGFWFDLYMGILAFCSFYFARSRKWLLTGVFWGLSFISKQTAIWFLIPIILEMVINLQHHYVRNNVINYRLLASKFMRFVAGVFIVAIIFITVLGFFGILSDFWNWAFRFGIFILPKAQGQIQLPDVRTLFVALAPFAIFISLFFRFESSAIKHQSLINLCLWAVAGFMGAYPRFEYFHFQPAVFYLAIVGALVLSEKKNILIKIFIPLYVLGSIYLIFTYFIKNLNEGTRFYEKEVTEVVDYVKYNTQKGDRIFVLNYWDNIYALTDTLPSTNPWVPQLSWYMEQSNIQEEMVKDLISDPPKLIVYKPYTSYGLSSYVPKKVYDYVVENYKIAGNIEGIAILIQK